MESVILGGGERSDTGGLQENIKTTLHLICFDFYSCLKQGAGLDGLTGPFQLHDSVILCGQDEKQEKEGEMITSSHMKSELTSFFFLLVARFPPLFFFVGLSWG